MRAPWSAAELGGGEEGGRCPRGAEGQHVQPGGDPLEEAPLPDPGRVDPAALGQPRTRLRAAHGSRDRRAVPPSPAARRATIAALDTPPGPASPQETREPRTPSRFRASPPSSGGCRQITHPPMPGNSRTRCGLRYADRDRSWYPQGVISGPGTRVVPRRPDKRAGDQLDATRESPVKRPTAVLFLIPAAAVSWAALACLVWLIWQHPDAVFLSASAGFLAWAFGREHRSNSLTSDRLSDDVASRRARTGSGTRRHSTR
jgi:hypothetical protein